MEGIRALHGLLKMLQDIGEVTIWSAPGFAG